MKGFVLIAVAAIATASLPAAAVAVEGQEGQAPAPIVTEASRIPRQPPPPRCEGLEAPADLPLYVVGFYDAATLSTTWLGDENKETQVVDVDVEPGPAIHLVITSYGRIIYRFAGATSRIARLTLMSHHVSGATGIPAERIGFWEHCLSYGQTDEANVRRVFAGRSAAAMSNGHELQRIRIGEDIALSEGANVQFSGTDEETDRLYHYHPGGISRVDPRAVAISVAVGAYRVLPQEAGVRQLVMNGALVPTTEVDVRRWETAARARGTANAPAPRRGGPSYGAYRVTRPTRIPAGLCGAHLIEVYAPSPTYIAGDPCHSTIFFDGGSVSNGATRGPVVFPGPPAHRY